MSTALQVILGKLAGGGQGKTTSDVLRVLQGLPNMSSGAFSPYSGAPDGVNSDGSVHYDNGMIPGSGQTANPYQQSQAIMDHLQSLTSPAKGDPFSTSPSATAAEGADTRNAAIPGSKGVVGFAAALRLAHQEAGGFNASPYEKALQAAQQLADTQSGAAKHQAHRIEHSDAALYGQLGNYIDKLQNAGQHETAQTGHYVNKVYNRAQDTIDNKYQRTAGQEMDDFKRLGLAGTPESPLVAGHAFQGGRVQAAKADAKTNARFSGDAFDRLATQSKGDVAASGTAHVAQEKDAMQAALQSIAAALSQNSSQINMTEAQAQATHQQQVRALAESISAAQAKSDPNSIDNLVKLAGLAHTDAETKAIRQKLLGTVAGPNVAPKPNANGYAPGLQYLFSQSAAGPKQGGIPKSDLPVLEQFYDAISNGGNGTGPHDFPKILDGPYQINPQGITSLLAGVNKLFAGADAAKGLNGADKVALENAVRILAGAYSSGA